MEDRIWFEYTLQDAWHWPVSYIRITEGEKPEVICWTSQERRFFEIGEETMNRIKERMMRLELKEPESPFVTGLAVSDGVINVFAVFNGKTRRERTVYNLGVYMGHEAQCPNAAEYLRLLEELEGWLEPYGVPGSFFLTDYPEEEE